MVVARPGVPVVERHEGRACRRDRLVVWWTMRVRTGKMQVPLRGGRPGKSPTIRIVGGVVWVLAAEQQVWIDVIRGPRCVDRVEEVVRGDRVDVGVQPSIGRRRMCGGVGSGEECGYEDGGLCEVGWLGRRGRAVRGAHRITGEGLETRKDGEIVKCL